MPGPSFWYLHPHLTPNNRNLAVLNLIATIAALLLTFPHAWGQTTRVEKGQSIKAGLGTQKGLWWTLGIPDGLSSNLILSMLQDRQGYLWIGTRGGGLLRYDGEEFLLYTTVDGLAGNWISSLHQSRNGDLWIGTHDGLSRFDGKNFTSYTTADGLAGNWVIAIAEGPDGHIWIGTHDDGLSRFNGKNFITYTSADGLAGDKVFSLLIDRSGDLWIGTHNAGLSRFNGKDFITYTRADGLAGDGVLAIAESRHGDLWFGTVQNGVSRYDGSAFHNYSVEDGLANPAVSAIVEDREGNIWFGTNGGLNRFDGETFQTYTVRDGLGNNCVRALLQDREGHLWTGAFEGGISRYSGLRFTRFTAGDGLPGDGVETIHEDRDGNLWFGAREGMVRYDGQQNVGRRFQTITPAGILAHFGDGICAIAEDRSGNLWWGTWGYGLTRYDGRSLTQFTEVDGVPHRDVCSLLADRTGVLWIGTWGGGVARYDGDNITPLDARSGFKGSEVRAMIEARAGAIWLATDRGLVHYDGHEFIHFGTEEGLPADRINALLEDRDGHLWIGTASGLSRYDGATFQNFTIADGLAHSTVLSLCEADDGHLWIGTQGGGVNRFDGRHFQTLTHFDGLSHDMIWDIHQGRDGYIWFATNGGLTRYHPQLDPPPVSITDVISDRRHGPISQIDLSPPNNHLTFEFRALTFSPRLGTALFRYKLDGFEQTWKTTRARQAEYRDLPTGTYSFQVQAIDQDLNYSSHPARVQIEVHPPYESTAWITALALAIGLIIWQTGRIVHRDRKLQKANRQLLEKGAQLEQANQDVQQATEAKSAFLASMSHELRTPMNSIINFSALILENVYGDIPEDLRDAVEEIDTNSDHLLQLINDILDLSKVEAGSMELQLSDCVPEACIDMAVAAMENQAAEKNLALHRHVEADLPILQADERRLTQQVLVNLLRNAIKFTAEGEIRVGARWEEDHILFWVSDTGIGIPQEEQELIFETFHQIGSSLTHQVEGTGLGLAIARQFVELHGGRIWVNSEVGRGSTFFFTISVHS
jgi:signal transduction histidine kinase/ligand-binding sensor domain-containing protein